MNLMMRMKVLFLLALLTQPSWAHDDHVQPRLQKGQLDLQGWSGQAFVVHGDWLVLPDQHIDAAKAKTFDFHAWFARPDAAFEPSTGLFMETHVASVRSAHAAFVMLVRNKEPRSLGLAAEGYKNDFEMSVYVPDLQHFFQVDSYGRVEVPKPVVAPFTTPSRFYNLDAIGGLGKDFYIIINARGAAINDKNWMYSPHEAGQQHGHRTHGTRQAYRAVRDPWYLCDAHDLFVYDLHPAS